MAELIDSEFSRYKLSDEETLQGSLLTVTQKQVIQNNLSLVASEKLSLELDMTNPNRFIQEEASLKGQIEAYRYMLSCSIAAEEDLAFRASNPQG